jgi:signal transduction histidine kinase
MSTPAQPSSLPPGLGETPEVSPGGKQAAEEARRALLERPRLSLRLQIFLGFFLALLLTTAIAVGLVVRTEEMEAKIHFLEVVSDYLLEVEQARRFEKNFFLYGSDLDEALDSVFRAEQIITRNAGRLAQVMGEGWDRDMLSRLRAYQALLERLQEAQQQGDAAELARLRKTLQPRVRKQGQKVVAAALTLMDREKRDLSQSLAHSRRMLILSLALLIFILVVNAYLLGSRLMRSITRFREYARRIATGDFTPITPTHRFRDEFTDLAVAINTMMEEQRKREALLIQSHKMQAVGTLTAGVAHELNNPLNNIILTAHMLQEDYDRLDDTERKEMVDDVVKEATRAQRIISNLLDFARESGSRMEPLDLSRLVRETIDLVANQLKLSGIKIEFQAADHLPRVHGDSQQLQQVFLNLILNARDASQKGDKIQVMVVPADEPGFLAVKVIDSGCGIPAQILPFIFDPFFTTKEASKGTGLGLSVSQGIVAKHGGRILVHSREGQGTTFTVLLPVTTIDATPEGETSTAA